MSSPSKHDDHALEVHDDPEPISTWVSSVVFVLLTVITITAVAAFYFTVETAGVEVRVVEPPAKELETVKGEQMQLLSTYAKYTAKEGDADVARIRIPVSRAMELIVAESAVVKSVENPRP